MNRPIFITGGSKGLGLEIARMHLRLGDRVALLARGRDGLVAAERALGAEAGRVWVFTANVRDMSAMRLAMRTFAAEVGPIVRLYANAGAVELQGGAELSFDRDVFETNVYGVINAVESWIETSPPPGAGVGIISSFSAFRGLPHVPAYGASKAAITLYAESLRGRLRASGFCVTTAFLGYLNSELASTRKPSFLVTPCSKAAEVVVSAVDRGATEIAYPPLVRAFVLVTRALPNDIYDWLVARRYRRLLR